MSPPLVTLLPSTLQQHNTSQKGTRGHTASATAKAATAPTSRTASERHSVALFFFLDELKIPSRQLKLFDFARADSIALSRLVLLLENLVEKLVRDWGSFASNFFFSSVKFSERKTALFPPKVWREASLEHADWWEGVQFRIISFAGWLVGRGTYQ